MHYNRQWYIVNGRVKRIVTGLERGYNMINQRIYDGVIGGIIAIGLMSCLGAGYSAHVLTTPSLSLYDTRIHYGDEFRKIIDSGKQGYEIKSSFGQGYGMVYMQKRIN